MTKRMLIDASHPEETRVVVLDGNRLEEFDLEAATKRPLKGNIYLAKVVRVEPSLQAAFVEYGGNRHGFLAFSEIHPDYYQIPVADRQRLLEMQAAEAREEEEAEGGDATPESPMDRAEEWGGDEADAWRRRAETAPEVVEPEILNAEAPAAEDEALPPAEPAPAAEAAEPPVADDAEPPPAEAAPEPPEAAVTDVAEPETEPAPEAAPAAEPAAAEAAQPAPELAEPAPSHTVGLGDQPEIAYPWPNGHAGNGQAEPIENGNGEAAVEAEADLHPEAEEAPPPETIGGEGAEEVTRERRIPPKFLRHYKIQEVIKRRQIMLVQVVKEERGTKGAALTTYISLAGRFSVLMPNSPRGGGVSRKITSATDRKRLREIIDELGLPDGMSLIIRTAGAQRPKPEIKRDCEYLLRLWETIREATLKSIAPALIYEEEDLVKRAIRDMFDKDLDGILVEGEAGYREARDFMRMIMPSQAKKIQLYKEPTPLFVKHKVEDQLSQIHSPVVQLKSGGYLVINQTEALVAIDVNSGKATRERNIEATALKTNLEAAEEATRQLRLRDLAGLIVIDFIDMDEAKNNRAVEKKLKDCLKDDRARVQMGKISPFGLMEISRQRRRTGVLEGTTHVCEHCGGTGRVRSVESSALAALRSVEIEALKGGGEVTLTVPRAVGLYILNEKRSHLARLHQTFGLFVTVVIDDDMAHSDIQIERTASETRAEHAAIAPAPLPAYQPMAEDDFDDEAVEDEEEDEEDEEELEGEADEDEDEAPRERAARRDEDEGEGGRRGRRRRRRGRRGDEREAREPRDAREGAPHPQEARSEDEDEGGQGRRRRRGRRGGRRMRDEGRAAEPFAWTRPWVPYGDDPFVWYDPSEDLKRAAAPQPQQGQPAPRRPANEETPTPAVAAEAAAPSPSLAAPRASEGDEEIWVELPPIEEKPKRARRSRSRGRAAEAEAAPEGVTEAVAAEAPVEAEPAPAPEPVAASAEEPPAKKPRSRSRKKVAEPAPEAASEAVAAAPAVEAEPAPAPAPQPTPEPAMAEAEATPPPASREPDPAEITAPPSTPRRGWWRR